MRKPSATTSGLSWVRFRRSLVNDQVVVSRPQPFEREFALLFTQQRSSPCPFGPLQYFNEFVVNRLVDKIPLTAADIRPASGQTTGEDVDLQGIADGTGIQLDPQMVALMTDIREQLGINSYENA